MLFQQSVTQCDTNSHSVTVSHLIAKIDKFILIKVTEFIFLPTHIVGGAADE